jgi:hypothetical protein
MDKIQIISTLISCNSLSHLIGGIVASLLAEEFSLGCHVNINVFAFTDKTPLFHRFINRTAVIFK